jgi:hypothetical protein
MVRNAISMMTSEDADERETFRDMVREVKQDLARKVAVA